MARNTGEKARGLTPVRNDEAAGAIPAESIKLLPKKFYQEAEGNLGGKPASGSGCACGFKAVSQGDFPNAEHFHKNSLKLPVWYNIDDIKIAELYFEAFKKVINNYQELF